MIKKFNIFESRKDVDPYGEERWGDMCRYNIKVTAHSSITIDGVLFELLEESIRTLGDEDTPYGIVTREHHDNISKTYGDRFDVQKELQNNITKQTRNSIIKSDGKIIRVETNYDISFPDSFEDGSILDWIFNYGFGLAARAFIYNMTEIPRNERPKDYGLVTEVLFYFGNNLNLDIKYIGEE